MGAQRGELATAWTAFLKGFLSVRAYNVWVGAVGCIGYRHIGGIWRRGDVGVVCLYMCVCVCVCVGGGLLKMPGTAFLLSISACICLVPVLIGGQLVF